MAFFNWFRKKQDKINEENQFKNFENQQEYQTNIVVEGEEINNPKTYNENTQKLDESEKNLDDFFKNFKEESKESERYEDKIYIENIEKSEQISKLQEDSSYFQKNYKPKDQTEKSITENLEKSELEEVKNFEDQKISSESKNFDQAKKTYKSFEISQEETNDKNKEFEIKQVNFFSKIKQSLTKTRNSILKGIENVLASFTHIDDELFEELEETLIMADIGVETSLYIINEVKNIVKNEKITDVEEIKNVITRVITEIMEKDYNKFELITPSVILVIGVNGVGKTTSIGKLTNYFKSQGKSVILAAADTFRAAAIEQLEVWGERNSVSVIKHQENSDPAAVIFDAIKASKARNADILICDTAGRLHNKKNLMEELKKIYRIISREYDRANIEVLLVLDATTGQNALQQAKLFSEITDITGLILTKLDGTAKGGVIISIKNELNIPVRFIGVGEGALDLRPFNSHEFAKALFEN